MNTSNIKSYAPKARNTFIAAMTKQAAKYGITAKGIEPMEQRGDLALIGDSAFPKSIARPRNALTKLVEQQGFVQTMEQAAYSWFNRLCAIRFMELKGYLEHGRRVLSHPADPQGFQILEDCLEIDISGMDKQRIQELKLDGTQDETLYRELLLAQCHALHETMPFLFEALDDATELLLPDNLTKTDSLIRELVSAIPEEDWAQVEIIGWLYQFYISEKKDQVIGKVVKSEDIPAATQLFTPNWIVQYLVQNSVGRQWLQTYPDSPLKDKMPYYIEPAEQTEEVQAQLKAITPDSIDPESIKVLDPACGSGHILVEAYKILKAIYEERGYRGRDIPKLILENNLFGLDIDDRAGQLAGFALMMLAREDDRRIFSRDLKLNVLSLQETNHLDLKSIWQALNLSGDWQRGSSQNLFESEQVDLSSAKADDRYQLLQRTLDRFSQAKTFGSLIDVPAEEEAPLRELLGELEQLEKSGDSMQMPTAEQLIPYVKQAWLLAQCYQAVVANPPYMGTRMMPPKLKSFVKKAYDLGKADLFSCFIEACLNLTQEGGRCSMITLQNWMFLSSFKDLRRHVLLDRTIEQINHVGFNTFPSLNSKIALGAAFVLNKGVVPEYSAVYVNCNNEKASLDKHEVFKDRLLKDDVHKQPALNFLKIDGSPFAYWASREVLSLFENSPRVGEIADSRQGMATTDNERFLRLWFEIDFDDINFDGLKNNNGWYPYNKGGDYRKWYGNNLYVVDYEDGGAVLIDLVRKKYPKISDPEFVIKNRKYYFRPGITWTDIALDPSCRVVDNGFIFDTAGPMAFGEAKDLKVVMAVLNSSLCSHILPMLNPSLHFTLNDFNNMPLSEQIDIEAVEKYADDCVSISRQDWDSAEISWGFKNDWLAIGDFSCMKDNIDVKYSRDVDLTHRLIEFEEKINDVILQGSGLDSQLSSEVDQEKVSLFCNPRAGFSGDEGDAKQRQMAVYLERIFSYSAGCMMGRYSLDREGIVYARSGNQGFAELVDGRAYKTFPADDDGIIPLNDQEWFPDDATNRFREFVKTVWGEEHLQENLEFVAESLCLNAIKPKRGESALDTIRRYLSTQFFKDHLKTYKKRPIYWLFSSGKQKAFECLVYLHRYNEGTLARMRTEYVIPLTAKLNTYVDKLEQDKEASSSTAEIKRLEKEITKLHKQQAELATFDEKLRHYADQRIALDLDDGVKVNYGKFGDLLAEVKSVHGKVPEMN